MQTSALVIGLVLVLNPALADEDHFTKRAVDFYVLHKEKKEFRALNEFIKFCFKNTNTRPRIQDAEYCYALSYVSMTDRTSPFYQRDQNYRVEYNTLVLYPALSRLNVKLQTVKDWSAAINQEWIKHNLKSSPDQVLGKGA